jgi:hypothetical protein
VKSLAEFQKIFDDGCARRLMGQTVDVFFFNIQWQA